MPQQQSDARVLMSESAKNPPDEAWPARVFAWGDGLAKSASLLAAMGYVSARWHWNALGISSVKPLSLSAYLAETLLFAVQTLWRLAPVGAVLLLVCSGIGICRVRSAVTPRPRRWLVLAGNPSWLGWMIAGLATILAVLLIQLTSVPGDLLVGARSPEALANYHSLQNLVGWTYELAWLAIATFAFVLAGAGRTSDAGVHPISWRIAWAPVILSCVAMPMLFGTYLHPTLYPVAVVSWKSAERPDHLCGILVGEQADSVLIWSQDGAYGRMLTLPEREVTRIATGPVVSLLAVRGMPDGEDSRSLAEACTALDAHPS
jgi:hypothetical protein